MIEDLQFAEKCLIQFIETGTIPTVIHTNNRVGSAIIEALDTFIHNEKLKQKKD